MADGTPEPPQIDRRRLLISGAFGVVAVGTLGLLPERSVPLGGARTRARPSDPASPTTGPPVTEPVALDGASEVPGPGHTFDTVIRGGRVVDPDSGYDQAASIGIDGATIRSISTEALTGRTTIDAAGLVVAPGFIDILSYAPNPYGIWFKIADGVTTNLGMHGINQTGDGFFGFWGRDDQRPPCHYGGAFDSPFARQAIGIGIGEQATAAQLDQLARDLEAGAAAGWAAVDFEPEYTPGVATAEMVHLGTVAADLGLPLTFHARYSDPANSAEGFREIVRVGRETGCAVHVDHVTSMGTFVMEETLGLLEDARREGIDLTADLYPYDFWATTLASARFAPGWQERFRIDETDLEVAGTGERLTAGTFASYQAQNLLVAAYAIPEADVRTALRAEFTMIGSDAILEPGDNNHPRSTGCFARTLGRYVRDEEILTLRQALAKMTILPARRFEGAAPALARKGRLQLGADADITIFDPATIGDRSTVADPAQESVGVSWVLVDGNVVRSPAGTDREARFGRPIRSAVADA